MNELEQTRAERDAAITALREARDWCEEQAKEADERRELRVQKGDYVLAEFFAGRYQGFNSVRDHLDRSLSGLEG